MQYLIIEDFCSLEILHKTNSFVSIKKYYALKMALEGKKLTEAKLFEELNVETKNCEMECLQCPVNL